MDSILYYFRTHHSGIQPGLFRARGLIQMNFMQFSHLTLNPAIRDFISNLFWVTIREPRHHTYAWLEIIEEWFSISHSWSHLDYEWARHRNAWNSPYSAFQHRLFLVEEWIIRDKCLLMKIRYIVSIILYGLSYPGHLNVMVLCIYAFRDAIINQSIFCLLKLRF